MARAPEALREHVKKLVEDHGVHAVANAYRLSQVTILRLIAGMNLRGSTLELVTLKSRPEGAAEQAQAIATYPGPGRKQGDE